MKGSRGYGTSWNPFGYIRLIWSRGQCVKVSLLIRRAAGPQRFPNPSIQRLEVTYSSLTLSRWCFQKQVGSQLSPESKNWKGHRPQHPPQAKKSPSVCSYAHNRAVAHRQLPGAAHVPRGLSLVSLCPTFTTHFWAYNAALHWRRGSPLTSDKCWTTALSWPQPSSELSGPSTTLVEAHLWMPSLPSPSLAPKPPPPRQHITGDPKLLPITHSREKSSHFVFPFQSTKTPCMKHTY